MADRGIDSTLAPLDGIVADARARRLRRGYFATMYRQVTRAVRDEVEAGAFDDGDRMSRFVSLFAGRYFEALDAWDGDVPPSRSWQAAFAADQRSDRIVLQHLMLGINAHINLDLPIVAARLAPGDAVFELEADFGRINDTLQRLMVPVQDAIGGLSPLLHVLWTLGGEADDEVLNFSLRVARRDAWQQAVTLAHLSTDQVPLAIDSLDRKVAVLARLVTNPGGVLENAVDLVAFLESDDVAAIIDALAAVDPSPRP